MFRAAARLLFASIVVLTVVPAAGAQTAGSVVPAVYTMSATVDLATEAAADVPWVRGPQGGSLNGRTVNTLFGAYAGLQALDMFSTIAARNNGAREANPLMNTSYGKATAFKAATSAVTFFATRAIAKKSRKGAIITMAILNGVTGAVVLNNLKNARR